MRFEWDESKRLSNLRRHGFDFVDAEMVFADETVSLLDDRFAYDEARWITIHTETDEIIRVISIRKASKNEEEYYFTKIRD